MKTFAVSIPVTGFIYHEVEAETEEEAIEKAFSIDVTNDDIEEWDMHESIVTGNVFHGHLNNIDVEEV